MFCGLAPYNQRLCNCRETYSTLVSHFQPLAFAVMKDLLRRLTPPVLWVAASKLRRAASGREGMQWEHGVEQPPEFYDWSFEGNEHWRVHYTESHY